VNGKIAPKSNVIGVADLVAQRGRRNLRPRQSEWPGVPAPDVISIVPRAWDAFSCALGG
jgi:hypothetical protein